MKSYYLYFETLVCAIVYLVYCAVAHVVKRVYTLFMTLNHTADWYSSNDVHFYEIRRAQKIRDEQIEEFKKSLKKGK